MGGFRTAARVALPFLLLALAAGPASASVPQPTASLTYGRVTSVRPGDTLSVDAKQGEAQYGDTMRSSVFLASGELRMMDPLLTTTVTVACEATPGTYPVLRRGAGDVGPEEHPFRWARVRVEPADEAARRACRDRVKKLPRRDPEERWAPDTTWPQSEWDVRTFRAGHRITITDNDDEGSDGDISLTSPAFAGRAVLRGARAVLTATATLKCDAAPGLYVVHRHEVGQTGPDKPWARLRLTRGEACSTEQAAAHSAGASRLGLAAWTVGGTLLAGVAGALFLRARSRRGNSA